jgi:hypothetical protein
MLHRLWALHPSVGWLSTFNEAFPTQTWLSVFSNLYRLDWLPLSVRHCTAFPKPFEAYRFWEHHLPNFARREAPLVAADVPEDAIDAVRYLVAKVLRYQRRQRFLHKLTGWARIAYLNRIFPDARFLWLQRDGLAVVSSWVKAGFLNVSSDIDSNEWEWGPVPSVYREWWRELGGGGALSAAVKVQLDLDDIERNMQLFPARSDVYSYEQLVADPLNSLKRMAAFCELDWPVRFEKICRSSVFYDASQKWRQHLSPAEADAVRTFFLRASEYPLEGRTGA